MDVRTYIDKALKQKKEITAADVVTATGVSRQFVNTVLQGYIANGKLCRIGRTNRSRYVVSEPSIVQKARRQENVFRSTLTNKSLEEDMVLSDIQQKTGIFLDLPVNTAAILRYAFTEMLNNAIDHSQSETINVKMVRENDGVAFTVADHGIGIYRNIMQHKHLANELEAVQDLLKGKQTTMPDRHSGEGIFFTSKAGDRFSIKSSTKTILFDNILNDIILSDSRAKKGTQVDFWISTSSSRTLSDIFARYAGEEFEFSTTSINVDLYKMKADFVSRSQARRITSGLDKFKTVVINFKNISTIGQSFTDEIFRVWKSTHPEKNIEIKNANENVLLMINHVRSGINQ